MIDALRRGLAGGLVALACGLLPPMASAQAAAPAVSQFVTLNQDRLFLGSAYGQRVLAQLEEERRLLVEESRRQEQALEAEELALTEARKTLSAVEFRAKADAFDAKVVTLRAEAEAAEARFAQMQEAERLQFFEQVGPVLWQLVYDLGAVAILDHSVVLLTTRNIDITNLAIARVDDVLGDGSDLKDGALVPDAGPDAGEGPVDGPTDDASGELPEDPAGQGN